MNYRTAIFLYSILIFSCQKSNINNNEETNTSSQDSLYIKNLIIDEGGPPFSDTCLSTFEPIGEVKFKGGRLDLILSGKGWNHKYYSCTWPWGELISNESPSDTASIDFRIHLVDLDKTQLVIDSAFLQSQLFKDNLIATYSKDPDKEYMTCKFDPNKTGKYQKPKQWTE